jgi:flagellar biosynthesis/type III secretory pathway chaperone
MRNSLPENKIIELQDILVKQFRTLQELIKVTQAEREALAQRGADSVLTVVEEKEAVLDQLSLIEDERRRILQDISLQVDLPGLETNVKELLPHLDTVERGRIERITEGIQSLLIQARDLNYGNQALAFSRLDWMNALQSFLVSLTCPETGYYSRSKRQSVQGTVASSLEVRA